jgi:hypothetical protein
MKWSGGVKRKKNLVVVLSQTGSGSGTKTPSSDSLSGVMVSLLGKMSFGDGQLSLARVEISRVERARLIDVGWVTHTGVLLLLLRGQRRWMSWISLSVTRSRELSEIALENSREDESLQSERCGSARGRTQKFRSREHQLRRWERRHRDGGGRQCEMRRWCSRW